MAVNLPEGAATAVKELIAQISHFQEGSKPFKHIEQHIIATLKKSDSMYFLNTKDIDRAVGAMADKFRFHSFFKHADRLHKAHEKYICQGLNKSDLSARLNVVKFLLCMSQSPTAHFCDRPQEFEFVYAPDESEDEVEDWGAYLNEGIDRWSAAEDQSPDLSDLSDAPSDEDVMDAAVSSQQAQFIITMKEEEEIYSFQENRSQLLDIIQHGWYNSDGVCEIPSSTHYQANIGILWEKYLEYEAHGLVPIKPANIISEYKVLREILWQMWGPHNSTVFRFNEGDQLIVNSEITIASVRTLGFENYVSDQFLPHIRLLDDLRTLNGSLRRQSDQLSETYKSYVQAHQQVMGPVMSEIVKIEDQARSQESTMTLLVVAQKLDNLLEPVRVLKRIHDQLEPHLRLTEPLTCTLNLITRLRHDLQHSFNKLEQDIRLTLYLTCLKHYLDLVDDWLAKNLLTDYTGEFVIANNNGADSALDLHSRMEDWRMNFSLRDEIPQYYAKDDILRIIGDDVLQIGRNLHLLRLLGKHYDMPDNGTTIYQEFLRRFLTELCTYFEHDGHFDASPAEEAVSDRVNAAEWENFVDTSDGFLMEAFRGHNFDQVSNVSKVKSMSLYEKISKITTSLFPLRLLPETILAQILRDKFANSGLMVKRHLVDDFRLDKLFEFLRHLFLFDDDLIFPFYRRLFQKMDRPNSSWGNAVWLTSHLHDILVDLYPEFHEHCLVQVKDCWRECTDPLEACSMINMQFSVKWPLTMIITSDHVAKYRDIFQFLLKLKWALYTINRLNFSDLEPKKSKSTNTARQISAMRLKYLRFGLINTLNSIQHYVFGFVLSRCRMTFDLDFEKASDLKSLLEAHSDFVNLVHSAMIEVRDCQKNKIGFNTLLRCVKLVDVMWNNLGYAWPDHLDTCCRIYRNCYDVITPLVNPVCV